ncbi:hypothetical protein ABPG75_009101 [Micractinium tetrahymenae]
MAADDVPENGKTGTLWTAVGHIFCAVVGAGVLGLPNSVAWLGWVAGPICLCAFFAIIMCASLMLTKMYQTDGIEFSRYHHLVAHLLGRRGSIALSIFQMLNLVLSDIAYTITGAIAMQTIAGYLGSQPTKQWQFSLIIGAIELVFSQIPSLEEVWWVSALGTLSSLGYVLIALGLGLAYSGNRLGSVGGRPGTSPANKAFGVLNALGNLAFAFGFTQVLLEIQDTLRQPPRAERTMSKAVWVAVTSAFGFYLSSAVACYAALGDDVPGEVLQGFEQAPNWVMVVANFFIVIHMITAWQVWAQPVFETLESHLKAFRLRRRSQQAALEEWNEGKEGPGPLPKASGGAANGGPGAGHSMGSAAPPHLPPLSEAEVESGLDAQHSGLSTGSLAPQASGPMRLRRMSARSSGGLVLHNSAPLPDLVPQGGALQGWQRRKWSVDEDLGASLDGASHREDGGSAGQDHHHAHSHLHRLSVVSRLGSQAMFHLDTGAANEHVPLNDQGYLLPFWQRLLLRSTYVLLCTLVACIIPFFSAVVGLVGAVTFWPLAIGFPFSMYIKVFKPRGFILWLLYSVAAVMLLVCIAGKAGRMGRRGAAMWDLPGLLHGCRAPARWHPSTVQRTRLPAATIGSCQTIIVNWTTYKLFS